MKINTNNKKMKLLVLMSLILIVVLAGCNKSDKSNANIDSKKPMVLTLSHHLSESDSNHVMALAFADAVKELSGGTMEVDIYANGQLFGQSDALAALRQGTLDITINDTALFANYAPAAAIFDLPYTFNSREHAISVAKNKEILSIIQDKMVESSGIRPISVEPLYFRNSLLKDMSINSFEDFKNIKMRTPESPTIIATFKAFSSNPTVIPSGEAYTSVQTGVADGLEGQIEYVHLQKFYEVAKNYVQTNHVMCFTAFSFSDKIYQTLTPEQQSYINDAISIAFDEFLTYTNGLYDEKYSALEEEGVVFTEVDLNPFKESVQDYLQNFINENDCQELYNMIQTLDV